MLKIVVEFKNLTEAVKWAQDLLDSPEDFGKTIAGEGVAASGPKKKDTEAAAKKEVEKPEEKKAEGETGVSKILVDLKEAGIQLADMKPTRYAGVETALAWFGVSKIKDLKEEDQPKVLKMFNKMIKADKAGYEELLESLKQ
jgi:hypothetical protein